MVHSVQWLDVARAVKSCEWHLIRLMCKILNLNVIDRTSVLVRIGRCEDKKIRLCLLYPNFHLYSVYQGPAEQYGLGKNPASSTPDWRELHVRKVFNNHVILTFHGINMDIVSLCENFISANP